MPSENATTSTCSTSSTCSYCGVGCGVKVARDAAGRLQLTGDESHPSNRGMLCSKGRALHHAVADQSDRLLYPQMRASRGHPLERVTWDAALTRAAAVFRANIARYGPESVGFYVSGQCLTEEYYVANKLMKGFIGCNNIDTNSRLCMSSAVAGYKLSLGDDLCPISYDDIEQGECYLIAGANPAYCHPILFRRLEQHKQAHPDAKVIIVDPRRTQSCSLADLHLQIQPGTDVALFNAIARVLIENNWIDHNFVVDHTEGFEALREAAMSVGLETAAATCRVEADDIRTAAAWIGTARAFQSWWAMGLNQSVAGVDKNLALLNLSLLTGQIGRPGAGPFSLTGQPNAMGGREVGGLATMLAAHHDLGDPAHREKVQRHWNSGPIAAKPGLTATEMFDALAEGSLRAIWIVCTNPMVSLPNLARAEKALAAAKFVVVQDISALSDTVPYADLVLPAAGWLEKEGTMTNSERRVTIVNKLIEPPGEALPDVEILCRFAEKMGWGKQFVYPSPEAIFDEHRALTRGGKIDMGGITYARLRALGSLQWPCPDEEHPGTPRLFGDHQFATPSGRARLHAPTQQPPAESTSEDLPLILTTGRIRDQWHTMTRTGKVSKLRAHENEPFLEVHPIDARAHGIVDGAMARISNDRGEVVARARVTADIKSGTVFLPMHWTKTLQGANARANTLTSPAVDPRSKEPDFKYAAVRIAPLVSRVRRILVVGAGAAALQFVTSYRKAGGDAELTVLGNEPAGFYNRIQLPHYIAGERGWESLATCSPAQLESLRIRLECGVVATEIDRKAKCVRDASGTLWAYDLLVLATGSAPALPSGAPTHLAGVHTLRTRADADAIRAAAQAGARAVVVGGGLLGVELAAALRELGVDVTLLHRSARLMGAQLDPTAADILRDELHDRGVRLRLQEGVAQVHGEERVLGVRTGSGNYVPCDLLVYAVGTRPHAALARDAGLHCGDGVIVDDAMRSNDPDIYAIGEVAEHRGTRHGTTRAAQQQAGVAAGHAAGNPWARYAGTTPLHVVKVPGLSLASIGKTTVSPQERDTHEQIVIEDHAERFYQRCIVHRGRLVGAVLVGDIAQLDRFKNWIEQGTELDEERRKLLRPGNGTSLPPARGRVVCSCLQVGVENLRDAISAGCSDLGALCAATRAGTGCGSCRPELQAMLLRGQEVPA
jgi:ferredoxin-nitrate reductase